jgi:hypothetical protein
MKRKRDATVKVIKLFEEKERQAWPELWEKAKEKGVVYHTLKRVMKRLVKAGIVKASVDEELTPVFTLLVPVPQILYLQSIIGILENQLDRWHFSIPEKKSLSKRGEKEKLLPDYGIGGLANSLLVCEGSWKKYVKPEDELKILEARDALFAIRERMILGELSEDERNLIHEYEQKVKELVRVHRPLTQEILWHVAQRSSYQGGGGWEKLRDFLMEKKQIEKIRAEQMRLTKDLLTLYPKYVEEILFSDIDTKEPDPKERSRLRTLSKWIMENGSIYEKYRRRMRETKLLLVIGFGLGIPAEKSIKLKMMLPSEWQNLKADSKFKSSLPWIKKDLASFGKKKVQYRCERCYRLFRNREKAEDHVRHNHYTDDVEFWVQEVDKAFYQELKEIHEKTFPRRPTVSELIQRSQVSRRASEGKDS